MSRSRARQTQPPPRFTEATLLTAMEGAGKLIEDEELREAMSERGLGTPATRAATIEGLLAEEYLHRNGRELQPTAKAFSLLFALTHLGSTKSARRNSPANGNTSSRKWSTGACRATSS
jgi:DNA topoisomerase-3